MKTIWQFTYSYRERYENEGVVAKVQEHIKNLKKSVKNITIVDIGCSEAQCTSYLKSKLENHNPSVKMCTIGVDIERSISKEAKRNVDYFILASAFNLPFKKVVDVVICQNLAYNFLWRERCDLFLEISKILKDEGAVVTNAGNYASNKPKTEMIRSTDVTHFAKSIEQNWKTLLVKNKVLIISQICTRHLITGFVEPLYRKWKHDKKKKGFIEVFLRAIGHR